MLCMVREKLMSENKDTQNFYLKLSSRLVFFILENEISKRECFIQCLHNKSSEIKIKKKYILSLG